jgi:signal transduction histidine kinase
MFNLIQRINSKIVLKIAILVITEIILIIGSFGVLAYFQSQGSSLGNSVNIAGKNRYLTANLLLHTEKYLDGSSDISHLRGAMDSLQSNILTLKQGGTISGVHLGPIPSNFLDLWKIINEDWNVYKTSVTYKILRKQNQEGRVATLDLSLPKKEFESIASNLIRSSDILVTQLGQQVDKNFQNHMLLQLLFVILNISILVLILYLVVRMLRPIFALTKATSEIKKGNLDVSIKQKGNDELSALSESFNSMVGSIKNYIKKQNELTKQLEVTNKELEHKDRLKNEFINVAAHELRTPIQPILSLVGVVRSKKGPINKEELDDSLDLISRNAERLKRLAEDILVVTRIESHTLTLDKERLDLSDLISSAIQDTIKSQIGIHKKIQLIYEPKADDLIFVEADRHRLSQVIVNLLSNAVKFTERTSGSISVVIQKKVNKDNDYNQNAVIISVRDTGTGIDPEIFPRLFDKFASKSFQGTGLGLFISKNIVEAHGGRIWGENNKDGSGATFSFSLPIAG